jgi:uncharacterized protein (TIGR03083 family)
VEISTHLDYLARDGVTLVDAAATTSLDAPVPGCPDWSLRDLLGHIGMVHRWAAAIVGNAVEQPTDEAEAAEATKPEGDGLLAWSREGHLTLVDTLHAAPPDVSCWTFMAAPSPLAFWARRQALETVVHRADAQAAAGLPVTIDEPLARDGIDELLLGFGARPKAFEPGTLRLEPGHSPAWLITLGPDGAKAAHATAADPAADATVAGDAGQVFLWLWNRPATVEVTGDAGIANSWGSKIRARWG